MIEVLVAYASKHHSTEGIAFDIGKNLRQQGLSVEVHSVDNVDSLERFDVVILGSAVYAGRWMKEMQQFLKQHVEALAQREVWLFSSGPTGEGDPVDLVKGAVYPESLRNIITQIQPRDIAVFHGKLDMNELGFGERLIVKGVKAPTGDFRDWEMIEAWAESIVTALRQKVVE